MLQVTEAPGVAYQGRIEALEARILELEKRITRQSECENSVSIIVSSNELDKVMPAFIIATGAASMGMQAHLFFTFWGIAALRSRKQYEDKNLVEKMMAYMLPGGAADLQLSKMNMMGAGLTMMKSLMTKHNVKTLPELMKLSLDLGVKLSCCQMSMGLMGIKETELMDGIDYCGVAAYLETASKSHVTLFI